MFDFSKYNLQELQAMSDLLDYLREDAGADALSYFCGCSLLQEIKRESLRLSRSILMSLEQQAHEAPELTVTVTRRKPIKIESQDLRKFEELYNDHASCTAEAPPAEDPAGMRDLQVLVDDLNRCSARLAALAHEEDDHYAESSQMRDFLKASMLRKGNRDVISLIADIRDYYDGLH